MQYLPLNRKPRLNWKPRLAVLLSLWYLVAPLHHVVAQDLDALVQESRELILEAMQEERYPGLSVAVSIAGETIWAEGFGYADIENQIPIDVHSQFRIGSISKPFTAAALAQLYTAGEIDIDAPIQAYVPSFPQKDWTVTTRQLGGHLAGIRHYRGDEMMSNVHYPTLEGGLSIFKDDPLEFEPGSKYQYSSYGWNLISAAIEGASGERFLEYVSLTVFDPLSMSDTEPDFSTRNIDGRVAFYDKDEDGNPTLSPDVDNSYKWAGGGFLSTPTDILKFANAHLSDDFLDAKGRSLLFSRQKTNDGESTNYGFGWGVRNDTAGRLLLGHTGGSVGGTSIFQMNADNDIVVALTINQSRANLSVGRQIMQLFLDAFDE